MHILMNLLGFLAGLASLAIVIHWLLSLGAVRLAHPALDRFRVFMDRLLDPLYRPIRRVIQPVNGIDFTPMVTIVLLNLVWVVLGWALALLAL